MSEPFDQNGGAAALKSIAAAIPDAPPVVGVLRALSEPALLLTAGGSILAANGAAAELFGTAPATFSGARLTDYVSDEAAAVTRYLAACTRTSSPLPGTLQPRSPAAGDSPAERQRVWGAVARPARPGAPALVLLRFRLSKSAGSSFTILNRQLEKLTSEVRARRLAETALLDANARLHEQALAMERVNEKLQEQAVELEYQVEEARRLANELVEANRALAAAAAAADTARALAEHANQAKSEFLAVMSHELRTPLNAIGGYVELLELGIRGPITDAQRDDLGRIQRAQRHLLILISEVLNLARLDAGKVHYNCALIPVDSVLRGLETLVAPQLHAQGLRYVYEPCADGTRVWADREKLEQIMLNLLSNAVKFTPPGGSVTLTSHMEDTRLAIRVRDTGVGITSDKLQRIFEPFVQLDQALTRSRDGVGLGLAISRDLARGLGGDLTVESTPGVGSTFTLTLPTVR